MTSRWLMGGLLAIGVLGGIAREAAAGVGGAATVTVLHGINGVDFGHAEALPIDVNVNGANVLAGVTFRTFSQPLNLPAGTNTVEIRGADAMNPGTGSLFASGMISVSAGLDYTLLVHLDLAADARVTLFFNDLSALAGRNVFRETLRHGAIAPTINSIWRLVRGSGPPLGVLDVSNGEEGGPADFGWLPANYNQTIEDAMTDEVLVGPLPFRTQRQTYFYQYLVGSQANGTLELLQETRRVGR